MQRAGRWAFLLAGALLMALPAPAQTSGSEELAGPGVAETKDPDEQPGPSDAREPSEVPDLANLEVPVFPSARITDALRIRLQSRFLPGADFDGGRVDLYNPSLRLQATVPLSRRVALQITLRGGASLYQFDGFGDPLGVGSGDGDWVDDFYDASLVVQGGYRINDKRSLLLGGEIWSVLASLSGGSGWEKGAFAEGLKGGVTVGVGYELPDRVRIGLGAAVTSRFDGGGVNVKPRASLRWNVTDRLTLQNRGRGLQLEYALQDGLDVFLAGFLGGDKFRLNQRPGLPDDLSFKDKGIFAGAGFEWRIWKRLRVNLEAGAVTQREIKVKSRSQGTLFSADGDTSAYLDVRLEIRP